MNKILLGIRKIIIIAAASVAIFMVSTPAFCADFYNAKPGDVPAWAQQGNFQFIRIDGGAIESLKAERTWWGKEFSEDEKEVLANIYDKYWDKMLALLNEAGFDWIWVTWSNGWSTQDEKANRKQLRKIIDSCHENGIHVTAYLSASNMFWESMFRDESESVTWLLINGGKPVNYGGPDNPMRFIADIANPDWRSYMVKKAKMAVEAGADAVLFDNIIGDKQGHEMLLSQVQSMAGRAAQKQGRPKIILYANTHEDPDRISINDRCEILWNEYGKSSPGVWDDGWYVTNARKMKFIAAEKFTWQPQKYENDKYHCGPREKCYPDAPGQKLSIAEAWGFGSSLSRNIEGRFLRDLIRDEPAALDAWAAITQYNTFINAHRDLYTNMAPVARIAVLAQKASAFGALDADLLGELLIKGSVMFDYKIATRFQAGQPLQGHKLLLIPDALSQLTQDEETALADFAAAGGNIAVLARGPITADSLQEKFYLTDRIKNVNMIEIDDSFMDEIRKHSVPAQILDAIQQHAGGPVVTLSNGKYVVANVMKKTDDSMFAVHLINYDKNNPEADVTVKLDLSDYFNPGDTCRVKLLSPDSGQEAPDSAPCQGGIAELTVPTIEHYAIVVVTP